MMVYTFFYKETVSGTIATDKAGENVNEVLAQELHKQVIKNFKRRKVHSRFKDYIWAANLAEIGSLSSFNCGFKYSLCMIDVLPNMLGLKL